MNIKTVSRYIGIALLFNAAFMLVSAFVSAMYGFDSSFSSLLISAIITAVVASFPLIFVTQPEDITIKEGFAITIFSWLLSCLFGMLPYVMWGGEFTLINAWFESVSGYTTTGSTILTEVESLPKGLIFWRSATHFIGGAGVVIFMLLVLPAMSTFRLRMSRVEISSISKENYKYKTKETIRVIVLVYIGLTFLSAVFLMIAGMDLFDAVIHAFSIVATGGFSSRNESILAFHSFPIELVVMIFMLLSGMHFGLLYSTVVLKSNKLFKSPIFKLYIFTILGASLLISINLKFSGDAATWGESLRLAFFQVISLNTTTGFATADTSVWPSFAMLMLMFVSIHTACSGSTTGGIKTDRMWIFLKSVKAQLVKQLHPNAVVPIKIGGHVVPNEICYNVCLYIAIYFFILITVGLFLSFLGVDMVEAMSASVAHLGNVGPGLGRCGSLGNYMHFPALGKFILTIEMLIGRLEIFTFLILLAIFKRN